MTKQLFELTLKNDDAGMFGGMSSEEIEQVDVDATIAAYEKEVTAAIAKKYPEIKVVHQYGPYCGSSFRWTHLTDETDETDESDYYDLISDVIGEIYNRGTFWVTK